MRVGFASVDTKFAVLREEMQVGFANIDTKFARLEGKIDTVEAKLEGKIDKLEERTSFGFYLPRHGLSRSSCFDRDLCEVFIPYAAA
jgi:hypothetical protein